MVYNKNKKGQAAIEFLMTYGWMLLVVLIVGALIFSFVDFGALLPNKVDLSGSNFVPLVSDSFASGNGADDGVVTIAFRYVGTSPITIDGVSTSPHQVKYNLGGTTCINGTGTDRISIYNKDTSAFTGGSVGVDVPTGAVEAAQGKVQFRNGHTGFIRFRACDNFNVIDNVEGDIVLYTTSTTTGLPTPNYGTLRLAKN